MYARAVDDAAARIRDLRREEHEDIGLALLALGLAVAVTQVRPSLAMPLFLGALVVGALGLRASWRRWDLVERLSGDHDAYAISEVLAFASRAATTERRHAFAASIRCRLNEPGPALAERVEAARDELEALVSELGDCKLELDPACAVACARLLSDFTESPLLNPDLPPVQLRCSVRQVRSGFTRREPVA